MTLFVSLYLHLAALVWAGAFGVFAVSGTRKEQLGSAVVSVALFLVAVAVRGAA